MTWADDITNSVATTLAKTDPDIELHVEYMDTKRVLGEEHLNNLFTEYRFKFKQFKFDAVIISDDTALRFALKHYNDLFPGTPVVFCGINNLEQGMLDNRPEFTGVLENVDIAETLQLALAIHPEAKRVYVINDMSPSGKGLHKEIAKVIPTFAARAEFIFLEDYTTEELASLIATVPSDSIILRSAFFLDKSGRSLPNEKISYSAVGSSARVPVYSMWDFYMGRGVVGGKMISGAAQGELASQLVIRIFNGEKPSAIPVVVKSPNRLMFDFKQMERFGITPSSLPPGSTIINEPLPFYAINKGITWTVALFTIMMTFISVLLVININRRKRTEETLVALKDTLQEQNEELQLNEESLRDQNDELTATEEMLRVQINEYAISKKLLKESEERFQALHNASFGGIIIHDKGLILECNRGLTEITGFTNEELIGMDSLKLIAPDWQNLVESNIKRGLEHRYEVDGIRKDGSAYPLAINGKNIPYKGREVQVIEFRDITERRKHEKEQLKIEKLESLGVLAGGIAHDFNNILTGIIGNISLAQMFVDATHKSYKPLAEAEKASTRAGELAHQLLTFARGGEPVKKVVSLQHIVKETVSLVLHGSNVKGDIDIPDSIHAIEADEGQMSQIFHNIIINATHAMSGGGTLSVTAQNEVLGENNHLLLPRGTYIRLTFTDQGCGISEDDLKRIFDPYFTTKSAGNGLGLASVHSIVSKHSGHIGASSEIGKGATFSIHLPSIGETYSKYQKNSTTLTFGAHAGCSILVMDDEEMIRNMTTEMLKYLGYGVTTCEDGVETITKYKEAMESGSPYSAVIMDLTIPGGMGGREAAEYILDINPSACLIVSSGYSNDPIMSDFGTYGFNGAMAKPYKINELAQMLNSVLTERAT